MGSEARPRSSSEKELGQEVSSPTFLDGVGEPRLAKEVGDQLRNSLLLLT